MLSIFSAVVISSSPMSDFTYISSQSIHALLYLGYWSLQDLIKTEDAEKISKLPNVKGEEKELKEGWDSLE